MSGFKYICEKCRDISNVSISNEFKQMEMHFKALRTKFLRFQKSSSEKDVDLISDNSSKIGLPRKRTASVMDELTVPRAKKILTRSQTRAQEVAAINNIVDPISTSLGTSSATSSSNDAATPQLMASVSSQSPIALIPTTDVGLTAVPKPTSVFVSRLNPKATVRQVTDHISLKLGNCNIIKVKKLTNNRRPVSSFKIDVNRDSLNSLLQKELWPEGTFVNIFENRSSKKNNNTNNRIRNTSSSSNVSSPKN